MMKRYIAAVLLVFALLIGCTSQSAQPTGQVTTSTNSAQAAGTGHVVDINMTAKDWEFSPTVVNVKQGDTVRIHVTSTDGDHGLAIEGYTESVKFDEGETETLEFVADKAGTFRFYCNVPCGPGHRSMAGQLIVAA